MEDSQQKRFANLFGKLILWAFDNGIRVKVYSIYRTAEEQAVLFAAGKSNADGYKKLSKHQQGLAGDLVIVRVGGDRKDELVWDGKDPAYARLGAWWSQHGGRWGGTFKTLFDPFHFEV